jgi:hypothetical protein
MNLDELEKLADAATPGQWVARLDGWTVRAFPDDDIHGINVAHTFRQLSGGDLKATEPDIEQQMSNQVFIAAANPQTIKQLIGLVRQCKEALEDIECGGGLLADKALVAIERFEK